MGPLIGFILGYSLGATVGARTNENLRHAWQSISESDELRNVIANANNLVADGMTIADVVMREGTAILSEALAAARRPNSDA